MSRDKLPPESEMDRTELLEQLVDEHGLAGVLDRLSDVCSLKAEHVRSNWQPIPEEGLPTTWDDAAAAINDAVASVAQLGLNVDATTVTRARQTGATVEQLRKETREARIAELRERINNDGAELFQLVAPTPEELKALEDDVQVNPHIYVSYLIGDGDGDRTWIAFNVLEEREARAAMDTCDTCGKPLDDAFGKSLGCLSCDAEFCSGECYDKHVAKSGHDS